MKAVTASVLLTTEPCILSKRTTPAQAASKSGGPFGRTNFQKPECYVAGLTKGEVGSGTFAISGDNLYQIFDADNESGFVEIASAKAYAKYSANSVQLQTTVFVINNIDGKGAWMMGLNGDLCLVKSSGTASGLVELHVATAASGYQSLSHFSMGFDANGTGLWIL